MVCHIISTKSLQSQRNTEFRLSKMITTSGGGALICRNPEEANEIMWYATQARDAYPYYQHTALVTTTVCRMFVLVSAVVR